MTDDHVRDATRRFRRRVVNGRSTAREHYLTPELREEAEMLECMIETLYLSIANSKTRRRVRRIRQGATVEQSRRGNWQQDTMF